MTQPVGLPRHRAPSDLTTPLPYTITLSALFVFFVLVIVLVELGLRVAEPPVWPRPAGAAVVLPGPEAPVFPRAALSPEWRWEPRPVPLEGMHPSARTVPGDGYRRLTPVRPDWIRANGR